MNYGFRTMSITLRLAAASILAFVVSSCKAAPDTHYVREEIPIEIRGGKPVFIKIHSLSGNGRNEVGIRCSPEDWEALMSQESTLGVRLVSASKKDTRISNISPGDHKLWPIDSFYYLFSIAGEYRATASIEISFPGKLENIPRAKIVVLKTPSDTGF
jgi:hypothetical protein